MRTIAERTRGRSPPSSRRSRSVQRTVGRTRSRPSGPCEIEISHSHQGGRVPVAPVGSLRPSATKRGAIIRWVAAAFDMHDRRQAEDALRASERGSRPSFTSTPSRPRSRASRMGCILSVNDAFLKMTGFARDDVDRQDHRRRSASWTAEYRACRPRAASRSAEQTAFELPLRTKDGRRAHARWSPAHASTSAASRAWSTSRPT